MEFRDFVAVGSLMVAATTLIYNWWSARGWRQKAQVRDELFRFSRDEDVKATVTQESIRAAHDAAVYLSIEIAENARRAAARRARRTGAAFRRNAVWLSLLMALLYTMITVSIVSGWNTGSTAADIFSTVNFTVVGAASGVAYVMFLREGVQAKKALPKLREFRSKVAKGPSLLAKDLRQHGPARTR